MKALRWLRLVILLLTYNNVLGRPKDETISDMESSLPKAEEFSPNLRHGDTERIEDIAIVARAANDDTSLNPSVAKVTDQLIDTIGQMVEKDVRTPPKLKEKIEASNEATNNATADSVVDKVEANGKFQLATDVSEGKANHVKKAEIIKGVAVPVIMDEDLESPPKKLQKIPNVAKPVKDEPKKKVNSTSKPTKEPPTTTPSSGLSTWILLSDNRDATTPVAPKNKKGATTTTTKKPNKILTTTMKAIITKPNNKKTTTKPEIKRVESVSLLEAMLNNQKKNSTTRLNQKKKGEKENDDSKKIVTLSSTAITETTEISTTEIPTTSIETSTKKKKTSTKKRKKNKNRRKKPDEKTVAEQDVKDVVKQPKQPVGNQLYNFLSREIMPTVGLGLVGVLVTAGLAGLLGYNPFVGSNLPIRRTYETQHGYSPNNNNYYSYNTEYGDTEGGQNEEVLFREVLSGMPEDSRYGMPQSEASYPEAQLYNSQEQAYDSAKNPSITTDKKTDDNRYSQMYGSSYEAYSNKESVSKYPVYSSNTGASYGYADRSSTTEKFKASSKYSSTSTIEKQPEALYRVSGDYTAEDVAASGVDSESSWHRIGSPMDYTNQPSHMEPGPRRLDLEKMTDDITSGKTRKKRSPEGFIAKLVRRSKEIADVQNDQENEIDVDDKENNVLATETNITENPLSTTTEALKNSASDESLLPTEETLYSSPDSTPVDSTAGTTDEAPPSLLDVVRRLAQFKLRLGLNFLKTTAEAFYRYIDGVQKTVESSIANDTTFSSMRNTWLGRSDLSDNGGEIRLREKRFQRNVLDN